MGGQNDRNQGNQGAGTEPETSGAQRDAGAEERIEQRRQQDREISRREDEGYDQPESSAQKMPNPGPKP